MQSLIVDMLEAVPVWCLLQSAQTISSVKGVEAHLARREVDEVEEEGGEHADITRVLELQPHGEGFPHGQRPLLGVLPQPLCHCLHLRPDLHHCPHILGVSKSLAV